MPFSKLIEPRERTIGTGHHVYVPRVYRVLDPSSLPPHTAPTLAMSSRCYASRAGKGEAVHVGRVEDPREDA